MSGKPKLSKRLTRVINKSCCRIWDGTRNLPYLDIEIYKIIGQYLFLETRKYKTGKTESLSGEEMITLELMNEYGSVTRTFGSPSLLQRAFRADIKKIVVDELAESISSRLLLHVNKARSVFDFNRLLELFKEELVAYQVLCNSEKEDPVIFYTPKQVEILGYA